MLNNRTIYTIQALCELARCKEGLLTAGAIAKAQGIPPKLIPQIFVDLSRTGFVKSIRGYGGGARLTRPPEKIKILEIIEAVQGHIFELDYHLDMRNAIDKKLSTVLGKVSKAMKYELARVTVADLAGKPKKRR